MSKTKLEIINETVVAYPNLEARAIDEESFCVLVSPEGKKCAIGRCMEDPGKWINYVAMSGRPLIEESNGTFHPLDEGLEREYRGHPQEFWSDLQTFHDSSLYFTEDGLTPLGVEYVKTLKERWT